MKTKFFISTLIFMFVGLILPMGSTLKADGAFSSQLPSTKYYEQEKGYLNSTSSMSRYASVSMMAKNSTFSVGEDIIDGGGINPPGTDETGPGFVGAPIGDVTPAIVLIMLITYMLFRRATTSRRKNL